jgi:hypothetical protein
MLHRLARSFPPSHCAFSMLFQNTLIYVPNIILFFTTSHPLHLHPTHPLLYNLHIPYISTKWLLRPRLATTTSRPPPQTPAEPETESDAEEDAVENESGETESDGVESDQNTDDGHEHD